MKKLSLKRSSLYGGIAVASMTALLVACSGDQRSGDDIAAGDFDSVNVQGAGAKGPLIGATVKAYALDASRSDLKGMLMGEGRTDESAQIVDLNIDRKKLNQAGDKLILIEFSGGTDHTNGQPVVFSTLTSVVDADELYQGKQVYATPLSTIALKVARVWSDGTNKDFDIKKDEAANYIKGVFGLGLLEGVNLYRSALRWQHFTGQLTTKLFSTFHNLLATNTHYWNETFYG